MLEFEPVRVLAPSPATTAIPLVFDSPHSGRRYPTDFAYSCDFAALRKAEDTDVDDLYDFAPKLGATLICAEFPRSYIDPNRRLEDVDTTMIDGHWPHTVDHSPKTKSGIGLVWRLLDDTTTIYARHLTVSEVQARIDRCYAPYWEALRRAILNAHTQHQRVFHINCHSMPARAGRLSWVKPGTEFADIVLGDRDGSTCAPEFTNVVSEAFKHEGLSVAVNDPYKGVELVKQIGKPTKNHHSIQVEINRKLYMNETTRERSADYLMLKASVEKVMRRVAAFAVS